MWDGRWAIQHTQASPLALWNHGLFSDTSDDRENGTMVQIQLPISEAEKLTEEAFSYTSSSQGEWP